MTHTPADEVVLPLTADRSAAGRARAFIREQWTLGPDAVDDAVLIVSELVTNAVQHGKPEILLRIRRQPFAIDIAVLDHGPDLPSSPAPVAAPPTASSGRGLGIVQTLAEDWGIEPLADGAGKTIWATLPAR